MNTAEVGRARRPAKPRPSLFGIGVGLAMVVLTVLTVWDWEYGTGFSLRAVFEKFGNDNPVISAIPDTDWDQMFSARTRIIWGVSGGRLASGAEVGPFLAA